MADDRKRQQAWRTGHSRPAVHEPGPKKPGGGKRLAVLGLILAVVGVVAGLIYFFRKPPDPIFLGLPVTQYAHRSLPPNPWAEQDSNGIREQFGSDSAVVREAQEKKALVDLLTQHGDRFDTGADRGRPMVIHLNALATVRDGKVYLLPGRADPDIRDSWLKLDEVLAKIRRTPGKRLLLLDLAHPLADAHAGMLGSDVGEVLDAELTRLAKAGELPFWVLTSGGKGEVSHTSLELQRSLFGFFLEQGLLGHADGWVNGVGSDGRVSVQELAEYVRAQVANWSAGQRLGLQNPTLYPPPASGPVRDFPLISPRRPYKSLALPESIAEMPPWLVKGWKERDEWYDAQSYRIVPRTYRELETLVHQAEQRWLAGADADKVGAELSNRIEDLKKQRQASLLQGIPLRSLAQARRGEVKDERAIGAAVRPLLERIQSKIPLKPEDLKPPEKPLEAAPFTAIIHHALSAAIEIPDPTPEQIKDFDAYLRTMNPPSRFIEMAALRLLVNLDAKVQEKWNDKALAGVRRLILRAATASEEAVAVDPRVLPWIVADLKAADTKHREAIVQLATGGQTPREEGRQKLEAAVKQFEQIAQTAANLEKGFQRLEEVRALLPALVVALGARAADDADEKLWGDLIANTARLQQLLVPPKSAAPGPTGEVSSLAAQLQSDMRRIRKLFQPEELDQQFRLAGKDNGPTAADLRRLLDSPLWTLANRQQIFAKASVLGAESAGNSLATAASLTRGSAPPAAPARPIESPAWRARLAIDLLSLDGITEVAPLRESLARATSDRQTTAWQELGDAIRREWAVSLPEKFQKLTDATDQERAGFVLHPLDVRALPEQTGRPPVDPTPELRRRQFRELWQWLARERYQKAADAFGAFPERADLMAYSRAMNEMRLELQSREP